MLSPRIVAAVVIVGALGATSAFARALVPRPLKDTSTNWAGYVVTDTVVPVSFTLATGTWKQPAVTCTARDAKSAIWVGLGGVNSASGSLEQIGTRADCTGGKPAHAAFYEVPPSPSVYLRRLGIRAGDTIRATVTIEAGNRVTFRIENLTSKLGYRLSVRVESGVRRSAEWIVEAPSGCTGSVCVQADLADFGSVSFRNVGAVGNGHPGTILDPSWHATAVGLTPSRSQVAATGLSHGAVPAALAPHGSSFEIVWVPHAVPPPRPATKPVPATPGGPYIAGPRRAASPAN